jgi:putative FmdB family regulatory protein
MPIYEFYCGDCHRVYSFLSRAIDTRKRPSCPRCGRPDLSRRISAFAISKGRKEPTLGGEASDQADQRLQQAMESLGGDAEAMNEEDPRQAARVMRKLFDAAGLPMGAGMEEALRRMEAGEDPEKIETEMGDVFEEDPFAAEEKGLGGLRHKLRPPTVDPDLYEM